MKKLAVPGVVLGSLVLLTGPAAAVEKGDSLLGAAPPR